MERAIKKITKSRFHEDLVDNQKLVIEIMDNFDKMDSLSEVSSTTTNSRTQINRWYSEENRKLIARKLDLSNGTRELHMDQVQVDRRRLESLLFRKL